MNHFNLETTKTRQFFAIRDLRTAERNQNSTGILHAILALGDEKMFLSSRPLISFQ